MPRLPVAVAIFGSLTLLPGCITLFSKTEVVRDGEARRPVKFECQEAADKFVAAAKSRDHEIGSTYVGVPFVTLYNKDTKLSEVAAWNDAVSRCDTDQDGLITLVEAAVFEKFPKD
ncbi:hypothetical protein [Limnoglobus roseus]|uniref:Uncharacterized protein n=1 Tax=Limnoglobus roseus TaxID=2598579 RepID=A0A5C1AUQ0_9BACT|nr:hypothetical protein [Limnoglobus roseus]QEL20984.1 hypothetical protein PX52LOC_08112 [Limnoglobus roseus]